MIVQSDDTRAAGLDHSDFNVLAKAHFVQTIDEGVITVDFGDAGTFASCKKFKRDNRHVGEFRSGGKSIWWAVPNVVRQKSS